ncbi:hypothetical protein [Chamaesiphon polymorphus]|uniref:PEP-CTERM sorting domain-containing protein n=1 Tax=Chamaesiphon polymorphus CCALA 037 TaxID=2107692 RepID=A0A2T1GJ91_9CYAN|nr:hypothetical protein [Chamaesiphon polymorphus]PSB57867.1 hypothetical protein C7B77_06830 [Chamaesiphon polymorphus CCALA 037]
MFFKSSILTIGFVCGLSQLIFASSVRAASIDFSSWNRYGDVNTPALGLANFSTNALQNDDANPDSLFNFSNSPAIDSITLEFNLGLPTQSLDPDVPNFIYAFEGSGLENRYTFTEDTILSFGWTFLTNDATQTISGFNFDDYSFIALNGRIQTLGSTNSSVNTLVSSSTNFRREFSGSYLQTLSPGTYSIALGVVDVGSFDNTSALRVSNAQLMSQSQKVPEPSGIVGILTAFGLTVKSIMKKRRI